MSDKLTAATAKQLCMVYGSWETDHKIVITPPYRGSPKPAAKPIYFQVYNADGTNREIELTESEGLMLLAKARRSRGCEHCAGTGLIETDNNGPIVACPVCVKPPVPEKSMAISNEESRRIMLLELNKYFVCHRDGHVVNVLGLRDNMPKNFTVRMAGAGVPLSDTQVWALIEQGKKDSEQNIQEKAGKPG